MLCKHNIKLVCRTVEDLIKSYIFLVLPKVSLLQKNSSSPVVCHATGLPSKSEYYLQNGQEYHDYVETGETLPNLDETFQKCVRVKTEEWKRNQYSCVVQHKSLIKDIQKILTEDKIISNNSKCNG